MADLFAGVERQESNSADWFLRLLIGAFFGIAGAEKFSTDPHWLHLFRTIGAGDWFRYLTGVVEVAGGILVLIPRTVTAGLVVLAGTMAGAAAIVATVLHSPSDALFPGLIMLALVAFAFFRSRS